MPPTLTVTGPTQLTSVSTFNDVFSCISANRACVEEPVQPMSPATPQDFLDVVGDRIMFRNAYRNFGDHETLILNHTVNVGASGADQAAVRWYEVRSPGGSPVIFQQSTYSPTDLNDPTASRWMGSIAMDHAGNIALGYSKSGTKTFPTPMVTGRLAGDAPGTMGAELVMFPGAGSQVGTGNRWGDYTAMTVDPRDDCTFWYTNEYLAASGSFNWHMRIAAFRFGANQCSPPPQGNLRGTITNCTSHAPLSDALVTLDNGFSGATDASGHYSIVTPPGTFMATPSSPLRSCNAGSPTSVTIANGGTTTQDFCLDGKPVYAFVSAAVDDSSGNKNGLLNRGECDNVNVTIQNVGCHDASAVAATISTVTPNLTLSASSSPFPNLAIGQSAVESQPYQVSVGSSYVCGTPAVFSLAVADGNGGTGTLGFSFPTCGASSTPVVFANQQLTTSSSVQVSRLGRDGSPSVCSSSKACPGPLQSATGTRFYNAHQLHTPPGTAPVCVNIKIDANCGAGNEIFSAAYSPGNGYTVTVSGYYDGSVVASQLALTCPSSPPVCAPAGASSTAVSYPPPSVAGNCGAAADAKAVALNFIAILPTADGDLRLFPTGIGTLNVTNLDFRAGAVRANNAVLSLAGNPAGSLTVQTDINGGTTDFVIDVNGYFK